MTLAEKCGFGDVDLKTAAWVLLEKITASNDHGKHPVDEDFRVSGKKVRTKKIHVTKDEQGNEHKHETHSDVIMGTNSDPYLAITPALVANGDRARELKALGWKTIENVPGFFTCTKFSEDGKTTLEEVQFKITNIAAPPKPEKPAKPAKAPKDPNAPKPERKKRSPGNSQPTAEGHATASTAGRAVAHAANAAASHTPVETPANVAVVGDDE